MVDKPLTIKQLIESHLDPKLDGKRIDKFLFAVNEELVDKDYLLKDDDTLAILPPLSGGAK